MQFVYVLLHDFVLVTEGYAPRIPVTVAPGDDDTRHLVDTPGCSGHVPEFGEASLTTTIT